LHKDVSTFGERREEFVRLPARRSQSRVYIISSHVLVYKRRHSLERQVIRVLGSEREQTEVYVDFFSMIREKHIMENMEIFLDK